MIKVRGVRLSLHPLFVLIMMASVLTGHFIELVTLFAIVFVHELGHAAAASMLGARVVSIQMLPFGGVAEIEDQGCLPAWKEIVIALAGPLQNLFMIAVLLLIRNLGTEQHEFIDYVIRGNLMIMLFNLLPVLPLDGGKIVQALLSILLSYHAVLQHTLRVSMVCSIMMCVAAIIPALSGKGPPYLNMLAMGLFLFYSNFTDYRNLPYRFVRFLLGRDNQYRKKLEKGIIATPIISHPVQHLEGILRLFKREKYHMIYVMNEEGGIIAMLPEQRLIRSFFTNYHASGPPDRNIS
ncbi:M50 family metallopeptidase [Paenibacillus massiliensis]|uniref:M50 family metallopeptidase n=1 Tax=Paenibacillus massiliensis TaxID=225917 RepID=UPI00040A3200|nr:M50 family metallopeptidase [Paenibacillus massiliensis]